MTRGKSRDRIPIDVQAVKSRPKATRAVRFRCKPTGVVVEGIPLYGVPPRIRHG